MLSEDEEIDLGDIVDRLVTVPVLFRAFFQRTITLALYEAARSKAGFPLTMLAAKKLAETVKPGDAVMISTGLIVPTWLQAETDGPIGAASLARSISIAFDATPVFLTEDTLVEMMNNTCRAAGLHIYNFNQAKQVPLRASTLSFPIEQEEARKAAKKIISEVNPSAIIAIERPSRNESGVYHTGAGIDTSPMVAKVDYLFDEAKSQGILTIGIGDHGGEIGFGCIKETTKRVMPFGSKCRCPCESGTAADTETDVLVVSAFPSNWGAYGVETCLAALLGHEEILHDSKTELRMIRACVDAGGIDSMSGLSEPIVDGVNEEINASLVTILHTILQSTLHEGLFRQKHKEYGNKKWETIQERVRQWRVLS